MAEISWVEFGGEEIFNVSRTVQLAKTLGINSVRIHPSSVSWIDAALGATGYGDITEAPWYDPRNPASEEFAGALPLDITGLDESSMSASTTEYITDGGNSDKPRNSTQPMVARVVLVAKTDRGAEFGRRWLYQRLRKSATGSFCAGADFFYFRYARNDSPKAHRRDVVLSRGASITGKRRAACSTLWTISFTWTANDPFEYGDPVGILEDLGDPAGPSASGSGVILDSGSLALTETPCPVYDYTPIYDPLYPALVPPPTAPDFLPDGWGISPGMSFTRYWAEVDAVSPLGLVTVPFITLSSATEARMVRVSLWAGGTDPSSFCDALFTAVVSYLPAGVNFYIDAEQKAAYIWDGVSPLVRRADTVLYGPDAAPIDWSDVDDSMGLMVSLDIFDTDTGVQGEGDVRASLALIPKSD